MEAIGSLAGGIAHDFNNILLGIVGYTELARAAAQDRPELVADLDQVLAAAERGRLLVRRILTFSQEREVARRVLRPEPLVREALTLARATLPSTVEVREHLDPSSPAVMADETEIHQIVMNLATNAAQAMGERGGVLEVSLSPFRVTDERSRAQPELRRGLHAVLRVADNGPGMPPEVVERAFEPFFTTKAPGQGTGLGLAMVHGIVKSYGGAATITSQEGRGTTVEILLPSADAALSAARSETSEPAEGRRILLVEDEETLAEMERRLLVGLGYGVTVCNSSLEALETFRARPDAFNLLITDNRMPHMTGLELTQEVVRLRPGLPVLMVSGLGEALKHEDLTGMGVTRVLRKPHRLSELSEALESLLGGH
jgi:CheY-like chemotaxis protein